MDITRRQITKIAREVGKFTVRTLRADGIGTGEFDVLHVIRKNPGITQSGVCRVLGLDKGAVAADRQSGEQGLFDPPGTSGRWQKPAPVRHGEGRGAEAFQSTCGDPVL